MRTCLVSSAECSEIAGHCLTGREVSPVPPMSPPLAEPQFAFLQERGLRLAGVGRASSRHPPQPLADRCDFDASCLGRAVRPHAQGLFPDTNAGDEVQVRGEKRGLAVRHQQTTAGVEAACRVRAKARPASHHHPTCTHPSIHPAGLY